MAPSYDFSTIKDNMTRLALEQGYLCAVEHNLLEFFKNGAPPANTGYTFWNAPELNILAEWYENHDLGMSGASFGLACRLLQAFLNDPEGTISTYST